MFSSKLFALFAVLVFGILSSIAAPQAHKHSLVSRCAPGESCATQSLPGILQNLKTNVAPPLAQLHSITADNCTSDTVAPIVAQLKLKISNSILDIKALVNVHARGSSDSNSTSTSGGGDDVTLTDILELVGEILEIVFKVLGEVLVLVGELGVDIVKDITPLLEAIGEQLYELVAAVLYVVAVPVVAIVEVLGEDIADVLWVVAELTGQLLTLLGITYNGN